MTTNLTISLAEAESRAREKDRERAHLVGQLGEQNQRLTGEMEAASRREEELTRQLEELRVQFQDKRETMRDHVMHLETLKDEVIITLSGAGLSYLAPLSGNKASKLISA